MSGTYELMSADESKFTRVLVTYTDGDGYNEVVEGDWFDPMPKLFWLPLVNCPERDTLFGSDGSLRLEWRYGAPPELGQARQNAASAWMSGRSLSSTVRATASR